MMRRLGTTTDTILLVLLAGMLAVCEAISSDDKKGTEQTTEPTVIRVQSNLVRVPVSVTDATGHVVLNLGLNDFRIEENGRPESLSRIAEPGQTPLELALLVDISGSILARFEFERQAAARFLQRIMRPGDMLAIFSVGPQPGLVQARTADLGMALRNLGAIVPTQESTAFYDSVVMAAHFLRQVRAPDSRRVQVVLSDGEDNNSESYLLASALQQVQQADCIFYSINPSGPSVRLNKISIEGQEGMQSLASETGGTAFLPEKAEDLDAIFDVIATELRAQYLLEYYSSDQRGDPSFRQIAVRTPNRPGLRIRARQGYYPARS
jgi:Ca-activated chloride channel family protein